MTDLVCSNSNKICFGWLDAVVRIEIELKFLIERDSGYCGVRFGPKDTKRLSQRSRNPNYRTIACINRNSSGRQRVVYSEFCVIRFSRNQSGPSFEIVQGNSP